jgi:hypothetical protein
MKDSIFYKIAKEKNLGVFEKSLSQLTDIEFALEKNPLYKAFLKTREEASRARNEYEEPWKEVWKMMAEFGETHQPKILIKRAYAVEGFKNSSNDYEYILSEYFDLNENPTGTFGMKKISKYEDLRHEGLEVFRTNNGEIITNLLSLIDEKARSKSTFRIPHKGIDILFEAVNSEGHNKYGPTGIRDNGMRDLIRKL